MGNKLFTGYFLYERKEKAFTEISLLCWEYGKLYGVKLSLELGEEMHGKMHVITSVFTL